MSSSTKPATSKSPTVPYAPTEREKAVVDAYLASKSERPPRPAIRVQLEGNTLAVSVEHEDQKLGGILLGRSVGSRSAAFTNALAGGLIQATMKSGKPQVDVLNDVLAVVQEIEPSDAIEALLATQMAGVHRAAMQAMRRVMNSDNLVQLEANDRCLNRLVRTFTAQMEALKRYRSGGQQKVVVEHVHVHEGGQAIVGDVHHTGGGPGRGREADTTA